jgi:choline dehydrogenase-like flavoprotein
VPDADKYEILILGSGEAGKYLAWTMAKAGYRTAMVERRWLGGVVPEHRMPAEQEFDLFRQGGITCAARCGIRS